MAPSPSIATDSQAGVILERGRTIDRFVVLGLVGRGGMGEVYAAYDPELDRKVAIKLLRARGDAADGRARLLREAQAIAKLQHPNVVVVYDVGTYGESVFIAMEFVEGRTVGGWLHAGTRTRKQITEVYLAAGRGLAAAHAAGLVHRDFKPDNVMVTNDGQVRVMDFGLARQMGEAAPEAVPAPLPVSGADAAGETLDAGFDPDATSDLREGGVASVASTVSGKYLSLKLTQTGAMLGTPAYMAPEQFAVRATDARTDQFSFCVALYEALYGQRPFAGETFLALMTSVTTGAVSAPPAKSKVPSWMRRVLLRGLQTAPEARFPSMIALLGALETDPTVRGRRVVVGVAVVALLGGAALAIRRSAGTQQAMCRGGAERLAGVWEAGGAASPRKDAIRRAFVATGKSYAKQAFTGASRLLDDYIDRWARMYGDACEATHVRGEQSAEVLDLRMGCLQDRLTSVSALGEVFVQADAKVVENAVGAAGALPRLEGCADVALLKAVVKPPVDEATRKRVDAVRAERARVAVLGDAGHCREAAALADDLITRAREVGYQPLLAQSLNTAGSLIDQCTDVSTGLARFREAVFVAVAAHDDAAATLGALEYGEWLADRQAQYERAADWLDVAQSLLERTGKNPMLRALLLDAHAKLTADEGKDLAAALDQERAAETATRAVVGDDHPLVLGAMMNEGNMLAILGRFDEALAIDRAAIAKAVALLGPEHPILAMLSANEGEVLTKLRRFAEAKRVFDRALGIWREAGTDTFFVAYGLTGLGVAHLGDGSPAEAIAPLEEAIRIRKAKHVDAEHLGETMFALARALWSRPAERERARALGREARGLYAEVKSPAGMAALAAVDAWLRAPSTKL